MVNARERAMLGYADDDALPQGAAWRELIHPDDRATVAAAILPHLKGQAESYGCEHRMRHTDGHYIWLSTRAMIVERGPKGEALRIVGTHLDITERKQAEQQNARNEERLSLALEGSSLALFDWDLASGAIYHSAQAAAMRGDPAIETTTPAVEQQRFVHPEDLPGLIARLKDALSGATELYSAEFRQRHHDGGWVWVRAQGRVVQRDASGRALRLAGTYADINDRKIAEGRLRRLAEFDMLTGLPNRALFHDRLQQAMARANRGKPMALLFLDVDRFKDINDTLGHEAGDKLLKVFAIRMQAAVRESDTVARLAGDEFTIILEGLRDAADARMLAGKLVETLRQPIELEGRSLEVTASIGVTLCVPGEGDDAAVLRRADAALYEAKRRGRNGYFLDDEENVERLAGSVDSVV
jgi:diguanylate cyclase (GGDEF)-like protein/PAS domain S-box-containing protein